MPRPSPPDEVVHRIVGSPVGELVLVARGASLLAVWVGQAPQGRGIGAAVGAGDNAVLDAAAQQLEEYFLGARTTFELRTDPCGTDFQREVWSAVAEIPPGETRSYGDLAARIGRPRAAQAVGSASARNPLSIVVPCHRVVGAADTYTGYPEAHARKRWLLELECRTSSR